MNLREYVTQRMRRDGYSGLYRDECGCTIDDLMPCETPWETCELGHACRCPHEIDIANDRDGTNVTFVVFRNRCPVCSTDTERRTYSVEERLHGFSITSDPPIGEFTDLIWMPKSYRTNGKPCGSICSQGMTNKAVRALAERIAKALNDTEPQHGPPHGTPQGPPQGPPHGTTSVHDSARW